MAKTFWLVNNTTREIISVSHDIFSSCLKLFDYGWKDGDYIFLGTEHDMDSVDNGKMWKFSSLLWNGKTKTFDREDARSEEGIIFNSNNFN